MICLVAATIIVKIIVQMGFTFGANVSLLLYLILHLIQLGEEREDYPRSCSVAPVPSTTLRPVAVPPKVPKTEADCDAEFAAGRMTERDYEKCLMAAQGVSPAIAGAPSSFGGLSPGERDEQNVVENKPKRSDVLWGK